MKFYLEEDNYKKAYIELNKEKSSELWFEATLYEVISWEVPSNEPFEDEKIASFVIKWDGCSHWYFEDYLHICGANNYDRFINMIAFSWQCAKLHIGDKFLDNENMEYKLPKEFKISKEEE